MGRLSRFDAAALAELLTRQHGVLTRQQAADCALTPAALRHRLRAEGPWQALLPGIYLSSQGEPTARQQIMAAYLYPGNAIAVTGPAALEWHSLPWGRRPAWGRGEPVDVLVPKACKRQDAQFVRLHRTTLLPDRYRDGEVLYAEPARAVADTARQLSSMSEVRAVVSSAVQRGRVTISDLAQELAQGPTRGSMRLRAALAEVADGIRSSAEGDLHALVKKERLPQPVFNARLFVGGELLAVADAWWEEAAVAAEVDSRQWHLSPADWERTMARHARMTAQGILVLHFSPRRIRMEGPTVAAEIRTALESARGRRLQHVVSMPA